MKFPTRIISSPFNDLKEMNVFSSDAWKFAVDVEWVENVIKK